MNVFRVGQNNIPSGSPPSVFTLDTDGKRPFFLLGRHPAALNTVCFSWFSLTCK